MENRVDAAEVDRLDRPDIGDVNGEPRMWWQVVAEPHRVDHDDVLIGACEQGLGEPRARISASAGHQNRHQMTIFPMVRNSCSDTGRSLQRRCAIAAAPMLPVKRDDRRAGMPAAGRDAAQREVGVAAADRVDDADAERRQRKAFAVASSTIDAALAVGHRERAALQQPHRSIDEFGERQVAARAGTARPPSDSGCSSRRRRT